MTESDRKRLDLLLLERGLVSTRTKAQELIVNGKVSVDGSTVIKPGEKFSSENKILLSEREHVFVSRGGLKLEAALKFFSIDVQGKRALDVGQSTGGFTHCLLLHGASAVVGVDVGTGQLAQSLREDARVISYEKQDIRTLLPEQVAPTFEIFVVDLSFVSLALAIPVLPRLLAPNAEGVVLVKPQFEVGPERVGSGGIVRDAAAREWALERVQKDCRSAGFTVAGTLPSPVTGGDGNHEFLLHLQRTS